LKVPYDLTNFEGSEGSRQAPLIDRIGILSDCIVQPFDLPRLHDSIQMFHYYYYYCADISWRNYSRRQLHCMLFVCQRSIYITSWQSSPSRHVLLALPLTCQTVCVKLGLRGKRTNRRTDRRRESNLVHFQP